MFFVLGITWIAEVISFLLNYGFAYDNKSDYCSSVPTNAAIIKASFLFDCINAFQGFIIFCVLFVDASMVQRVRKHFCRSLTMKATPYQTNSGSVTKLGKTTKRSDIGEVKFDHHEQQLTIRTNRTWRTPSPQPTGGAIPPLTTQVEVTEEYCSRSGIAIEPTDELNRGIEVTRFELTRQSGSCNECSADISKQLKNEGHDSKITKVDFSMQFP